MPPRDLELGSFTEQAPWTLAGRDLGWRAGAGARRASTRAAASALTARRRLLPPARRTVRVVAVLGAALGGWWLRDRGTPRSRAGLSRRLRRAFERLGPTYIKLGQILSAGEGLFPEELVTEFRRCRDPVPPVPFAAVERVVGEDLGAPLAEVFDRFERAPIAAASIAQVHAARLRTGEEVVVKVQRPAIARLVHQDLAVMGWLAPLLVGRIPVAALANPPALVDVFAETIAEELDFRLEADSMLDVAAVLARTGQGGLVVPRPHPTLVTRRVLVMERLDGYPWGDADALRAAGIDTVAVLTSALVAFLEGLVLFGVFHGDLHPGNLLVRPDGRVALLDFGITGRLDETKRRAFLRLVMTAAANDVRGQVAALRDLGAVRHDTDIDALVRDLGLDGPAVDPTTLSAEELTRQIREVTKALMGYGARIPKELMLFVKDLLFIDGAMATMAPDVDVLAQVATILGHLQQRHGERIAGELGLGAVTVDMAGIRGSLGMGEDEVLTHRDIQERRRVGRERPGCGGEGQGEEPEAHRPPRDAGWRHGRGNHTISTSYVNFSPH